MRRDAGPAIEVQPRLATIVPERWPVKVFPARDELLSSWLHRLAFAHGLSPHHLGEILGVGSGAWSTRLDLDLPEFLLNLLHRQTGVGRDRIAGATIGAETWRPLVLPARRNKRKGQASWLQFCPLCLVEDETPYFRRAWRRASVMTCRRHRRALLDRCPSCCTGLAPFEQRALLPQHHCAHCGFDLRDARAPGTNREIRQRAELIDDLVRLEAAKGLLDKSALIERILALPSLPEQPRIEKFTRLSTAERIRCLERVGGRLMGCLGVDPDPTVAAWRRSIIAAGGTARAVEPLLLRLTQGWPVRSEARPKRSRRGGGAQAVDLHSLLSAYGAVNMRRERQAAGHSKLQVSSASSSSMAASNSWSPSSEIPKAPSMSRSDWGR